MATSLDVESSSNLDRFRASSFSLASSAASRDKSRKTRSLFSSTSSLLGLASEGDATWVARDHGIRRVLSHDDIGYVSSREYCCLGSKVMKVPMIVACDVCTLVLRSRREE